MSEHRYFAFRLHSLSIPNPCGNVAEAGRPVRGKPKAQSVLASSQRTAAATSTAAAAPTASAHPTRRSAATPPPQGSSALTSPTANAQLSSSTAASGSSPLSFWALKVKWSIEGGARGKFPVIRLDNKNLVTPKGIRLDVHFDGSMHTVAPVTLRLLKRSTKFEPKSFALEIILVQFKDAQTQESERERATVAQFRCDLVELQEHLPRLNASCSRAITSETHDAVVIDYTFSNEPGIAVFKPPPPAAPSVTTDPTGADASASATAAAADSSSTAFVGERVLPRDLPIVIALHMIEQMRNAIVPQFASDEAPPIVQPARMAMTAPAVSTQFRLPGFNPTTAYHLLLGDHSTFESRVHEARGNRNYQQLSWQTLPDCCPTSGGWKWQIYDFRANGRMHPVRSYEYLAVVKKQECWSPEFFCVMHMAAPQMPMLNDSVFTEVLIHIAPESPTTPSENCVVKIGGEFCGKLGLGSGSILRTAALKQLTKFLVVMERIALQLAMPSAQPDRLAVADDEFPGFGSVLDGDVWARLSHPCTKQEPMLVCTYLRMIYQAGVQPSAVTNENLELVKGLLFLHRHDSLVVGCALECLFHLAAVIGYDAVVQRMPTIGQALRDFLCASGTPAAVHMEFARHDHFIARILHADDAARKLREASIGDHANPWEAIRVPVRPGGDNGTDVKRVAPIQPLVADKAAALIALGRLRSILRPTDVPTREDVQGLLLLMRVHMGDEDVVELVAEIVSLLTSMEAQDAFLKNPPFVLLLGDAFTLHGHLPARMPEAAAYFSVLSGRLPSVSRAFPMLEDTYAMYQCKIRILQPEDRADKKCDLFVTMHYLCVGSVVIDKSFVQSIRLYVPWFFSPRVTVYYRTAMPNAAVTATPVPPSGSPGSNGASDHNKVTFIEFSLNTSAARDLFVRLRGASFSGVIHPEASEQGF